MQLLFRVPGMLIVMTVDAQQLPVATIFRVVVMIMVTVMHRQLMYIGMGEFAGAAAADPRVHLQGLLPVPLLPLFPVFSGLGNDLIQFMTACKTLIL